MIAPICRRLRARGAGVARIALILILAATSRSAFAQERAWTIDLSAGWYMLPGESDYVQPTLRADRDRVHLESRYAYEDRDSLSFFAGANFEFGKRVQVAFTPMIGGLVGAVDGVIPAAEITVTSSRLDAYGEAEFVFDLGDSSSKFFYMWSEVGLRATEWLRGGLVTQRTRVYQTERDIQRGPFVAVAFGKVGTTLYVFNPDADDRLAVLAVSWSF
jgi:hypothetical protein